MLTSWFATRGNYTMRLTDEKLDYMPGRPIVFDDSFEHEV